ncbi:MarR family winged helix-turn-helix transcriptional regulator [Pseudogracilibacillus auburnensis]|uniref:MarR family winged helix-turn-helix transcriptional regulator n=1 Tax=Pseudogracilibacillus auburnensis TaxID=1494959 RepID=UPI001A97BA4E|nr:MarR family winged helix-turn-helix transcriptional regulator [Pseudogracilibacillus auburnensis]MBO1005471.1 winged helix-turn-helix transcriptional regulator [Pseudogracilibacillus auburnensis]
MTNLNECYCINLRTAARRVSGSYNATFKPLGINVAQYSMLRRINRFHKLSITKVGEVCELDRSTAGRNLKVLEKMGLVTFTSAKDRREMSVSLSVKGLDILEKGNILWIQAQKNMEDKLGGEENANHLLALLKKL